MRLELHFAPLWRRAPPPDPAQATSHDHAGPDAACAPNSNPNFTDGARPAQGLKGPASRPRS